VEGPDVFSVSAATFVVIDNRFGDTAVADKSEPDLPPAFGVGFSVDVGVDVAAVVVSALVERDAVPEVAPALPGVVAVIGPPELSTFIPPDGATACVDPSVPVPASEPLAGAEEAVVVVPAVPPPAVDVSDVPVPDADDSVD
jgi:hypothetical protein